MAQTSSKPPEVDPQELEIARDRWVNFTKLLKFGLIGAAIVLAGLLVLVY